MGTPPEAITREREFRLFDSGAVGLAAFIASPVAGTILIAVNYVRLGKTARGVFAVTLGMIATALPILIRWNFNTPLGRLCAFGVLTLFVIGTWQVAKDEQADAVKEHTARGGKLGSRGTAILVGIATMAALFAVICSVLYVDQDRKILVGGIKDQVIYSGLATKAEATALGNVLKNDEYFLDRGSSVLLNKGFGATTISFAVQNGIWNQEGTLSAFDELAREVAPTVGGLPIQVHLIDTSGNVQATSTVGEVGFGGSNGIYYEGSATKDEAQALGQRLESMGFFRGNGANLFLTRHDDGTTVAFVVVGEAWNNPTKVSSLEAIVREVAPTVGGLPINMRLVDTQLQVKKDELIQ